MRKRKKRKVQKRILSLTNMIIVICSVLVSYSVVALSNSFRDLQFKESKLDNLTSSAYRIAIAFEQYNEKRFTP